MDTVGSTQVDSQPDRSLNVASTPKSIRTTRIHQVNPRRATHSDTPCDREHRLRPTAKAIMSAGISTEAYNGHTTVDYESQTTRTYIHSAQIRRSCPCVGSRQW